MTQLINALNENTRAVRKNTAVLSKVVKDTDKESNRVERRQELLDGVPYSELDLFGFKRQDLVMLAAQLGVTNTSVPQAKLVKAVVKAQDDV